MSAIKGVDCSMQEGDGYLQKPLEKSYFMVKITDPIGIKERTSHPWGFDKLL